MRAEQGDFFTTRFLTQITAGQAFRSPGGELFTSLPGVSPIWWIIRPRVANRDRRKSMRSSDLARVTLAEPRRVSHHAGRKPGEL